MIEQRDIKSDIRDIKVEHAVRIIVIRRKKEQERQCHEERIVSLCLFVSSEAHSCSFSSKQTRTRNLTWGALETSQLQVSELKPHCFCVCQWSE